MKNPNHFSFVLFCFLNSKHFKHSKTLLSDQGSQEHAHKLFRSACGNIRKHTILILGGLAFSLHKSRQDAMINCKFLSCLMKGNGFTNRHKND
jgi:hypothetical protein